jgi:hypothetical protein
MGQVLRRGRKYVHEVIHIAFPGSRTEVGPTVQEEVPLTRLLHHVLGSSPFLTGISVLAFTAPHYIPL